MIPGHSRIRAYLVVIVLLGVFVLLREALFPLLPIGGVSQSALIAGDVPFDTGEILVGLLFFVALVAAGAFLAAPWATRQHRRRRGLCVVCGYPLSMIPHASRCPECGHATVA